MNNKALLRTLECLTHPLTLIAVLLIVLNDFVLKPLAPSWLTGKISDVAWLVIAPLVITALLALIMPRRAGKLTGPLAMIFCAVCFTALKASPELNHILLGTAHRLTGIPWATTPDPTDLLVLPAAGISWLVWTRPSRRESRPSARQWTALAAAALVLIADAPAPFQAIACFQQDGDRIIAYSDYSNQYYGSADGGISWQNAVPMTSVQQGCEKYRKVWEVSQPGDDQVRYRLTYEEGIERSADGGKTWRHEVSLNSDEARYYYYRKFVSYAAGAGPYDAIFDTRTGNLVVAMGFEGVLVRDANGTWSRVAVGEYHREDLNDNKISALLSSEIELAVLLLFLIFPFLDKIALGFRRWDIVLAVISWGLWGFAVLLAPASIGGAGDYIMGPMLAISGLGSAISAMIWLVVNKTWQRRLRSILRGALLSLCGSLLFLMPFLLWAQGTITRYQTAQIAALAMLIVVLASSIIGMLRSRKVSQIPEPSS